MNVILEKNVPCTLRDGVTLYADVYRPADAGMYPVLLTRLPYSKYLPHYSHRYLDTNRLVANGYVVIIQDVRGRFESEGTFFPFESEAEDGYDTVEWTLSSVFRWPCWYVRLVVLRLYRAARCHTEAAAS